METDDHSNRIKILHIHNPHLLWVEYYAGKHQKCKWRQIGLFGVVPAQSKPAGGATTCSRWDPATNDAMLQFAGMVEKLYFKVTYCDESTDECDSTSIFGNAHLFGEVTGIANNELISLSAALQGTGLACASKKIFFKMLTADKIETKLNEMETENVLKKILNHYQNKGTWALTKDHIYRRLSPYHVNVMKRLEKLPKLTAENIESYQRNFSQSNQLTCIDTIRDKATPKVNNERGPANNSGSNQDSIPSLGKAKFVEDILKKHMIVETIPEPKRNTGRDKTQKPRLILYDEEITQDNSDGKINNNGSDISDMSLGRANSRLTYGNVTQNMTYGHNDTPYRPRDPYEEEMKFDRLKKLKEKGMHRSKQGAVQEYETAKQESQNRFKEAPRSTLTFLIGHKENKEAPPRIAEVVSDNLVAYGPPMCDRNKYVVKKPPKPVENQIPSVNVDDTANHGTWKERNIDSGDEEINNDGSDLNDNSHMSLGRANSRLTYGNVTQNMTYGHNDTPCRPRDLYEKEIKFDRLKELKEKGMHRSKQGDVQESQSGKQESQNRVKEASSSTIKHLKASSRIEVAVKDNLVAYGPPMCDRNKYVVKNPPKPVENQIIAVNVDDTANLWKERNIDSGDEEINTVGNVNSGDPKKSFRNNTQEKNNKDTKSQNELVKNDINKISSNPLQNDISIGKPIKSKLLAIMLKRKVFNDSSSTDDSKSLKEHNRSDTSSTNDANTTASSKDILDSDDDDIAEIQAKLNSEYKPIIVAPKHKIEVTKDKVKINVNPHKNLDGSRSVFVEDMVAPLLLAHTKNDNIIRPRSSLRDIPFKPEIHATLQNMRIKEPSRLQSVSWAYVLRGHSVFMIGAAGCGKTIGYLPAVCNLVMDYNFDITGKGPICIIVCATAQSVSDVAKYSKMFLNHQRVVTCYPGMDSARIITNLLNGCDILVSTPSMLYRLLGVELGVDLRRLTTVVFDDCERLAQAYESEVKAIQFHVKQMLKSRADKLLKVQYVLASRMWCGFMYKLAKRAPDTIVTFVAFQECVLYSKTNTTVIYVKGDKVNAVVEFLKETDDTKLTVIVCRTDYEVDLLENTLKRLNYTVVACNNKMTLHDLYKIRTEGYSNSILICCDGNLSHLNVTYANYLVHFSMPALYSQFCARFSVLNDNYPSIFGPANDNIKIKILMEETNVEQLPKILAFVKRCTSGVPEDLNEISRKVLEQKDLSKAQRLVPICDSLMSFGECMDAQTLCQERHAILGGYDDPKDWLPNYGTITFKITHYHSAVSYSARLLTHEAHNETVKYPDYCHKLSMKLGIYFGKDQNKRLHGEPRVGDICAVYVRQNFVARCQVLKILSFVRDKAKDVLVNMVDEEKLEIVRSVELHHLPDEFKSVETHIVKVRLANIQPQDKDLTFPETAKNRLESITDGNDMLYLKGRIIMAIGNCIFVDTLVACENLSNSKSVVKENFKELLLETYAENNPDHVSNLKKLCDVGKLKVRQEPKLKILKTISKHTDYRWAHLEKNDWSEVVFSNTVNAGKFFVRLQKFEKCVDLLVGDIRKYVSDNPKPVESISVRDAVLAEFPDDEVYERAIIEEIIDEAKVVCFFVDNGEWREVSTKKLKPIPEKYIKQIPFQAIECRLIGVRPPGQNWPEFSSNWLDDNCLVNDKGDTKRLYVKYFTKENAEVTNHKYGVILIDTDTEKDVVINNRMIEMNLAAVDEREIEFLKKPLDFTREITDTSSLDDDSESELQTVRNDLGTTKTNDLKNEKLGNKGLIPIPIKLLRKEDQFFTGEQMEKHTEVEIKIKTVPDGFNIGDTKDNVIVPYKSNSHTAEIDRDCPQLSLFPGKLVRSVPLVNDSDEDSDIADVYLDDNFKKWAGFIREPQPSASGEDNEASDVIENANCNGANEMLPQKRPAIVDSKDEDGVTVKSEAEISAEVYDYPKIVDIREDVRSSILKDASFYDSESTLSISDGEDLEEAKDIEKERSLLDSDDISVLTDDKEGSTEAPGDTKVGTYILKSDNITNEYIPPEPVQIPKIIEIVSETITCGQNGRNADEIESQLGKTITITEKTGIRKPQLTWKQDKHFVTVKIKLVGVETYTIETTNRSLRFEGYQNEVRYTFDIELYGVIENGCSHSNKGQYILVTLKKMQSKSPTWLSLAKGSFKNWIVYDVDSLGNESSSDDDDISGTIARKIIMDNHKKATEDEGDEIDEMPDDSGYRYRDD